MGRKIVVRKKMTGLVRRINLVFILLVIEGCVSQVPPLIRQPPLENPSFQSVREDISRYQGTYVRWGGTIVGVQNQKGSAVIEIIGRKLGGEGRPREASATLGRFLVLVDDFLDPAIYRLGRDITVYGSVEKIMENDRSEPLLRVKVYHLWSPRAYPPAYYPYPYWKPRSYY